MGVLHIGDVTDWVKAQPHGRVFVSVEMYDELAVKLNISRHEVSRKAADLLRKLEPYGMIELVGVTQVPTSAPGNTARAYIWKVI